MNVSVPHIVQYQGSKRILAPQILRFMPKRFSRMIEPFAGTAAMTIAAAMENRADQYVVNDINAPLVGMLEEAIECPQRLLGNYARIWNEQFSFTDGHVNHFYKIRELFNAGETTPEKMLYILARCVKGSVRYGRDGNFNQSPDKRRHGTSPRKLAPNLMAVSRLLKGRTSFLSKDYREVLASARKGDVVYMDPPYQGVSDVRDNRYLSGVPFQEFVEALESLNNRGVDYLISYDGVCGGKEYGQDLPDDLGCKKYMLRAGLSTQATFLGRKEVTFEALYVSSGLLSNVEIQCVGQQILHEHLTKVESPKGIFDV